MQNHFALEVVVRSFPCRFLLDVQKVCPNSYLKHPCLCCPICLPMSQENCSLN
ncbi:hypothetical protein Avbf_15962 [Armadillidium vulgare]|nr:hypothetical protein Avbf_15962 [Armadillidium vulgare]